MTENRLNKTLATCAQLVLMYFALNTMSHAQFADETGDESGITNPADFSWRYYRDQLERFPERIGLICYNAYLIGKAGDHKGAIDFFSECAARGNAASMVYLSMYYEYGIGTEKNLERATSLLKTAAQSDYAAGQFHYGVALLKGSGVVQDKRQAAHWLARAAANGNESAQALVAANYDLSILPGNQRR